MKTNILTLLLALALSFFSNAQTIPIIDSIFEQQLINLGYDTPPLNGVVWADSISSIDTLIISGYPNFEINDLSGIEHFYNLQYLDCSNNNIDTLNLNQNSNLKYLNCSSDSINTLIIDNLYALTILNCSFNVLTEINLSGNPGLTELICFRNELTTLNLTNNTFLGNLDLGENNITTLDVSMMNLEYLNCQNNALSSINLHNNTSLSWLICYNNNLQEINLSDNINLETLNIGNVSSQPSIYSNNLHTLNISTNCNLSNFISKDLPNLSCIQVCDTVMSNSWNPQFLDPQHYFSLDCNYTSVDDVAFINDVLISLKDIYGREVSENHEGILFYIYKSGKIEKRIILDN